MTPDQEPDQADDGRRLTPDDVRDLRFPHAGVLHPGYDGEEVERFRGRVADELARSAAEREELQARVRALEEQLAAVPPPREAPSDQAVRILAVAQQTADQYVAEAEDFSRQVTSDARTQSEEQLRSARETAGAIIQAAHEAASRLVEDGGPAVDAVGMDTERLREEVAYLKAFGQSVRVQLRSYLEALITDVETEWGQASPQAVSQAPGHPAGRRPDGPGGATVAPLNVVADVPVHGDVEPGAAGSGGVEVSGSRR
jgi:DivIVA domain-containing protein